MMNDITIQSPVHPPVGTAAARKSVLTSNSDSFGEILTDSIKQVNRLEVEADSSINDLATGRQTDIHRTMIAMEKASISFELLMQIRNKVISAYDRIMRMPI
jgi:flagellar hook-basal body complex protein FliE